MKQLETRIAELTTLNTRLKGVLDGLEGEVRALGDARRRAERENAASQALLSTASHRLHQLLQTIALVQDLLAAPDSGQSGANAQSAARLLKRAQTATARLLDRMDAATPDTAQEMLAAMEALARNRDAGLGPAPALRGAATARIAALSARERQVLALVLEGCPSKNIAADLGVSQRTVENHRAAIRRKMGVRSLAHLVRLVMAAE